MTKELLEAPINRKVIERPETPYLKAKAEWDERIGSIVVQAKNWRILGIVLSIVTLLLTLGIISISLQQKVTPVVIALNQDTGEPSVLGKISELNYKPKLLEIKYFLSEFIKKVRSVPSDPVIIKRNWTEAYKYLRREAANKLNTITNNDRGGALNFIGTQSVIVQPVSIERVGNSNSYQARWREARYNKNGGLMDELTMSGVFTLEFETPEDETLLSINPLGIFIVEFGWSREL